jgi:RNA polymerase sigma factor (sigma-70 family)
MSLTTKSDGVLDSVLGRLAADRADEGAWLALYQYAWPRVMAISHRIVHGRRELAEDVAQEVFLRLLKYTDLARFPSSTELLRYLAVVARNAARDLQREHGESSDLPEIPDATIPEALKSDAMLLSTAEVAHLLTKLSGKLGDQDRRLVDLLAQGFTVGEIARNLGISYSNAGVRIHRLRRVVGKLLIPELK